jgi:hypothetical protein
VINYSHEMDLFETRVFENTGVTGVCNWDNGRMTIRSSQIGFHPSNGVVNRGTLSVSGSEIFGNRDPEDYYLTAGIVNLGTLSVHDTLIRQGSDGITNYCNATVTDSTISDNLDTGIFYYDPARRDSIARRYGTCDAVGPNLRVSNTTISGNTRGIYMVQVRPLRYRIEHSTIAYNEIGLHNEMNHTNDSVAAVVNSLVVNNSLLDCNRHTIPAQGTNLDSDGTCSFTGRGHISNVDPLLGPLEDNGGNTPTHRLLEGSPAIDRAFEIWCLPADQRSMGRPAGGGCDIGAFELEEETVGAAREPLSGPTQTAEPLGMMVTETPEVTPTVAPIEVNFNADSYAILVGECTRLRWDVQNADLILLEGEPVPELEAEQVCPKVTKTYTLVASNTMEEVERYVNIEVTESVTSPKAPAQLNITNQVCTAQTYSVTLGWIDAADNEDGYRVYRDGNLIANLGSNAKGFTDTPPYGGPYSYGVEAFNSAGASPRPTVQEPGCIY